MKSLSVARSFSFGPTQQGWKVCGLVFQSLMCEYHLSGVSGDAEDSHVFHMSSYCGGCLAHGCFSTCLSCRGDCLDGIDWIVDVG